MNLVFKVALIEGKDLMRRKYEQTIRCNGTIRRWKKNRKVEFDLRYQSLSIRRFTRKWKSKNKERWMLLDWELDSVSSLRDKRVDFSINVY